MTIKPTTSPLQVQDGEISHWSVATPYTVGKKSLINGGECVEWQPVREDLRAASVWVYDPQTKTSEFRSIYEHPKAEVGDMVSPNPVD